VTVDDRILKMHVGIPTKTGIIGIKKKRVVKNNLMMLEPRNNRL